MNKKVEIPEGLIERFIMKPTMKPYFGRTVTKNLEFDEWTEDKTVHQTLKDLKLTTVMKKKFKDDNGLEFDEDYKLTIKLKEGIILIWTPEEGYVIPKYEMGYITNVIKDLEELNTALYGE